MEYQIVNEYMARKYPSRLYNVAQGNNCIWVTMHNAFGGINLYFIIKDNKIVRVDID